MAQNLTDDKKEILQDLDGDDLTPPSYCIMKCLPPSAPPGLEAALMPNPGPGEVPAAAAAPLPALPGIIEPPSGQLRSQRWRPLVSATRIPPQPDLLDCIHH